MKYGVALGLLIVSANLYAGVSRLNSVDWVAVASEHTNNSNFIQVIRPLENDECNVGSKARIRFSSDDSALLSLFLSAKTAGKKIGFYYKTSTNLPGMSGHGTSECEIENAWLESD